MAEATTGPWWRARLDEVMAHMTTPEGGRYAIAIEHGTLEAGVYAPRGCDPQEPHDRDEVYVVMRGTGTFVHGDTRQAFAPGDLFFVPAGVVHCFEDFSDDLALWVLFYGPRGGEAAR